MGCIVMIVMPSNNVGPIPRKFFKEYPDKIAQLFSPDGWSKPKHQYALDNGAFKQFNEKKYFNMLLDATRYKKPLFCTVPDVVGCHDRTLALWWWYFDRINDFGYPMAFVAQDGCTIETVPNNADWIFIGGLDPWKLENIHIFTEGTRPVHVGRVNSFARLEYCKRLGVKSVDGTGWMRARDKKYYDFIRWFEGDEQMKMFNGEQYG